MPRCLRAVLVVSLESWLQDRIRPCRRCRLPENAGKHEALGCELTRGLFQELSIFADSLVSEESVRVSDETNQISAQTRGGLVH